LPICESFIIFHIVKKGSAKGQIEITQFEIHKIL
jgi:hypothetical protein